MVKTSGLLDLYDPPRIRGRNLFWDELGDLFDYCGLRWCLAGDFNVVRSLVRKRLAGEFLDL